MAGIILSSRIIMLSLLFLMISQHMASVEGGLVRRDSGGDIEKMLINTILPGISLVGKTIDDLLDGSDAVRTAGVVENFSRWTMFFKECTYEHGEANVPMQSVKPGYKEGFAAHKSAGVYGVYMKCTFVMNTESPTVDEKVHFMIDVPWDLSFTKENRLAMAVCNGNTNDACNSLSLSDMSVGTYDFMARRIYKNSIANIAMCNKKVCLIGTMGTSHTPIVRIKVYPRDVDDLSEAAAKSLKDNGVPGKDYESFLDSTIKYSDKNPANRLKVCSVHIAIAALFAVCAAATVY